MLFRGCTCLISCHLPPPPPPKPRANLRSRLRVLDPSPIPAWTPPRWGTFPQVIICFSLTNTRVHIYSISRHYKQPDRMTTLKSVYLQLLTHHCKITTECWDTNTARGNIFTNSSFWWTHRGIGRVATRIVLLGICQSSIKTKPCITGVWVIGISNKHKNKQTGSRVPLEQSTCRRRTTW